MSYTKGPWTSSGTEVYDEKHRDPIACCLYRDFDISVANARLISASPDLLSAAEEVVEAWSKFIDSFEYVPGIGDTAENIEFQEMMRLRMAINKAKGINQ